MTQKTENILRWIATPVIFVAAIPITWFLCVNILNRLLLNNIIWYFNIPNNVGMIAGIILFFVQGILTGLVVFYTSRWVAPSHKKTVGIIAGILFALFALYMMATGFMPFLFRPLI